MRIDQLFFEFGKTVLRSLTPPPQTPPQPPPQDLPKSPPPPAASRTPERVPSLEAFSRRLLWDSGWKKSGVRVQWNPRLRTTAGLACWRTRTVSLNPRLQEISHFEVERTLLHELAHLLAQFRAGSRRIDAHGPEWREACCDLGIPNEPRCHDLPFARRRQTRKYFYACPQCGNTLARVRPIRRSLACIECCRRYNRGRYDDRFRFQPTAPPSD